MHEDIFAAFLLNEAESLGIIEPFHLSLCHRPLSRTWIVSLRRKKEGQAEQGLRGLYRSEVIFCQDNATQLTH